MKTPLLVDTCALLWLSGVAGQRDLGAVEKALNEAAATGSDVFLSPMTGWEIGMLAAKGRLSLALPVKAWLNRLMTIAGMRWAELSLDVLLSSHTLPGDVQGDPADRIIIATAREYGLCLLTRDRRIIDYSRQGHVMALPC